MSYDNLLDSVEDPVGTEYAGASTEKPLKFPLTGIAAHQVPKSSFPQHWEVASNRQEIF